MSSNFVTPGQAYEHTLTPIKGYVPDYPLDVRGKLDSNVDLTVVTPHSGRVVYPSSTATLNNTPFTARGNNIRVFSMGCAGDKKGPPIWLWAGVFDPDISNQGTPSGVASVGASGSPPSWVSVMPGRDPASSEQLWGLVGFAGLEVETTEFDTAQTYTQGQFLRAVTLNNNADGGKVTNQNASSGGGAFATTAAIAVANIFTDTIVGQVGKGSYLNSYDRKVLNLYTCFFPGTR